jgi:hypothetical protein
VLAVLNVLGSMLMLFSVTYVLPIITSLIYRDRLVLDFVGAALGSLAVGASIVSMTRGHKRELRSRDGFLLVTLGWVLHVRDRNGAAPDGPAGTDLYGRVLRDDVWAQYLRRDGAHRYRRAWRRR